MITDTNGVIGYVNMFGDSINLTKWYKIRSQINKNWIYIKLYGNAIRVCTPWCITHKASWTWTIGNSTISDSVFTWLWVAWVVHNHVAVIRIFGKEHRVILLTTRFLTTWLLYFLHFFKRSLLGLLFVRFCGLFSWVSGYGGFLFNWRLVCVKRWSCDCPAGACDKGRWMKGGWRVV